MSDRETVKNPRPGVDYRTDVDGYPPEGVERVLRWANDPISGVRCWMSCYHGSMGATGLLYGQCWRLQPPAPAEPEPEEDGWRTFEEEVPGVWQWIELHHTHTPSKRLTQYLGYLGRLGELPGFPYRVVDSYGVKHLQPSARWRPCAPPEETDREKLRRAQEEGRKAMEQQQRELEQEMRDAQKRPSPDRDAQPEPGERYVVRHLGRESRVIDTSELHDPFVAVYHEGRWPNQWEMAGRLADLLNAGERAARAAGVPVEELAKWVKTSRAARQTAYIRAHDAEARVAELEAEVERLRSECRRSMESRSTAQRLKEELDQLRRDNLLMAQEYNRQRVELESELGRIRGVLRRHKYPDDSPPATVDTIIEELESQRGEIASLRERSLPEGVPWPDDMSWGHRHQIRLAVSGNWVLRNYDAPAEVGTIDECLARLKEEMGDE